jgi:hypothetical protein
MDPGVGARVVFFGCDRHAAACQHPASHSVLPLVWFLSRSCFRIDHRCRAAIAPILIRRENEAEPAKNFRKYFWSFGRGRVPRPSAPAAHCGKPACRVASGHDRWIDRDHGLDFGGFRAFSSSVDRFIRHRRMPSRQTGYFHLGLQRGPQLGIAELHPRVSCGESVKTWMPGTKPDMTNADAPHGRNDIQSDWKQL